MVDITKLNVIGDALVIEFKQFANKHKATGALERSVKYKINGGTLYLTMLGYAKDLDEGTKPHEPNMKTLTKWSKIRGVNVYVVANKIRKYGTKAYPFLYRFQEIVHQKVQELEKEYGKEILALLIKDFRKNK